MTGPTEIAASLVCQEDIGPAVETLRTNLQPPCAGCQLRQVGRVGDDNEEVDILRVGPFRRYGTEKTDPHYAVEA